MAKLSKIEDRPTPPEVYNWRVYVNTIIATFAAAMIGYDSAWLVSRNRNESAMDSLSYIRNLPPTHPYIVEEMVSMEATIEHERSLAGAGFLGPIRAVFASKALVMRLAHQCFPTIFKSIGVTSQNNSLLTTGVYGIIKIVGALVWLLYLVDQFGRRAVLIGGSAGGAVCMYYIAVYISIAKPATHPTKSLTPGGKSAIAFFYLWTVFYSPTWNGTPWVYTAEVFPQHVRVFSQACMAASNWLYSFLIARFTPQMFTAMGYGVYLFFASLMIVTIPFVFYVPETKQIPLERMDDIFTPGLAAWRAHSMVMDSFQHGQRTCKGQVLESFAKKSIPEKGEIEQVEVV
ncbi:hypothetical protein J3R30DRAFT_3696259 [Lentinula aciculospora]|uniref:Major facilitator superfamily (MFS) profile domain-containing protein n=1 Tax=Lentinula aciculospora TaxID=153920 RepID=A0A9W9ATW3_9AGAR|nr:hypothetical protein J3R30DRAFT_3696259 [Lentinula aciculospora]